MKQIVSALLCVLLATPPVAAEKKPQSEKILAKLVEMQSGSIVQVTQRDGRWKGRLGDLGAESFQVQVAVKDQIEMRSFRYGEVQGVRNLSKAGMHPAAKIALGILAGAGVYLIVILIWYAAYGWDS